MDWIVFPPSLYVEALTSNAKVFGGETFGRQLGLDEVTRVEPP